MPFCKSDHSPIEGMNCETFPYITSLVDGMGTVAIRADIVLFSHPNVNQVLLQNYRDLLIIKFQEFSAEFQAFIDKQQI